MSLDYYNFKPNIFLRNGFFQTIFGSQISGYIKLPRRKVHKIKVDKKSILILTEIPSEHTDATMVLLAHGMGGCSESNYIKRIARKLWIRGFNVFMMNHRGCGLGMGLSESLWHGGISGDLSKVIDFMSKLYPKKSINIIGFSLSGNVLLKYLGEKKAKLFEINKAFAVNPPIDLKLSSQILSFSRKGSLFNKYYMKQIHCQADALAECFPDAFLPTGKEKTILEFDKAYTAPAAGYANVDDYYLKCSSKSYLENITVPTTILCSEDDPFIEPGIFKSVRMSNAVDILTPEHGGHMGYIQNKLTPWGDYRWMDFVIVDWAGTERKL